MTLPPRNIKAHTHTSRNLVVENDHLLLKDSSAIFQTERLKAVSLYVKACAGVQPPPPSKVC